MVYIKNSIPIVLAFTPSYIIPAATTIVSVLVNSGASDRFEIICLLTEDLPQVMKDTLSNWDKDRLHFTFLLVGDQLNGVYIDERYTVAASYRLLIPEILSHYQSVIYLDCDVIVRNDLAKLYRETPIANYYLAAVYEASLDFQKDYLDKIGCKLGEYINSGFLIMNLERMRNDNLVPKLIEKSNNPNSDFPDQDAINLTCKGNILGLSPIHNSIRTYFLPQYKSDFLKYYSEVDWQNVQRFGTIHYTGSKPWNGYTVEFTTWWKYYEQLPISVRKLAKINTKLLWIARLLRIPFIRMVFNVVQRFYRKLK